MRKEFVMEVIKSYNQYYGKYFENAVCAAINGERAANLTGFDFPAEDIAAMNADAALCAEAINGDSAEWVGNHTSTMDCDAIIDGVHTEIKYTSNGNGTYYNTSMTYFDKFGFTPYKVYMEKEVYPYLEQFFGPISRAKTSPVSMKESKDFRHNHPAEYKTLTALDKAARAKYVAELYDFLNANPAVLAQFVSEMVNKTPAGKSIPQQLVVFNYTTKNCSVINANDISALSGPAALENKGLSLRYGNLRFAFSWQNGTALNNPTIRVFID